MDREESQASIARQQARLSEMEVSLIEKGAQKMLDNHDIYGAIQLLINSMDNDLQCPSEKTARLEKILRQSVDSLYYSKDSCVSITHYTVDGFYFDRMIVGLSKKLIGFSDDKKAILIIDSKTGCIVKIMSSQYINQYVSTPFDANNTHNWKYGVIGGKIFVSSQRGQDKINLNLKDIHPDDTRCLIVADDTTLLDCYIYTGQDKEQYGCTRLCIHNLPDGIYTAAYSESGNEIAIQLFQYKYLLYDANTGRVIKNDTSETYAQSILANWIQRNPKSVFLQSRFSVGNSEIQLIGRTIYMKKGKMSYANSISKPKNVNKSDLYIIEDKQDEEMRNLLDTLSSLPALLTAFTRSFYVNGDTLLDSFETDSLLTVRYNWPLAINPNTNRVVMARPIWKKETKQSIYGLYPHNGAIFYHTTIPYEVHTLHFTEDDQYLVVNYGEETQEVIYLPPLEQLVDSCKNMFFDWQMTEEERYQTYIHMND